MLDRLKSLASYRWRLIARWEKIWAKHLRIPAARIWRHLMFRTKFIAVCGSAGKTTTKELLGAILEQKYSVIRTSGTWGGLKFGGVPGTILKVRPWHKYAIVEAGIESKGQMATMAKLIKPDIVVMLSVKECHIMEFKTLDNVAHEKSQMVKSLSKDGVAVLNGDDSRVSAMADIGAAFRVERFGWDGQSISVQDTHSNWPGRLELNLAEGSEMHAIKSQLVGTHWVNAILAAVTAARQCEMTVSEMVPAIEAFAPFWARMQPITLGNGITFLRDDWNGSYDTFVEALKVLQDASHNRKIAVISDYSDSHSSNKPRQKFRRIATQAAACVDLMICVGERGHYGRQAAIDAGLPEDMVFEAYDTCEASEILKGVQLPGDLVLLKGRTSDHLTRVYLDQLGEVACTRQTCPRQILCDRCGSLGFEWKQEYEGLMAPPGVIV